MFIAALFTKIWRQPPYGHMSMPIDRGMDKRDVVHVCNGILLHHVNKQGTKYCHLVQLEIIVLSEVSRQEKDKYHMISLTCGN